MWIKIVKNNVTYWIQIERMGQKACKDHYDSAQQYVKKMSDENVITITQSKQLIQSLKKWKQDCSHSMAHIVKHDHITNQIQDYSLVMTQSAKNVKIIKPLTATFLGEQTEYSKVIKISEGLYVTSHSLIIDIDLSINSKLEAIPLKYDHEKNCYVDTNSNTLFTNITKENVEKIVDYMEMQYTEIKKVDITATSDVKNDVAALKHLQELQKGTYNKKTYAEVVQEMDKVEDEIAIKFTKIEKDIKLLTVTDSDEL